MPYRTLYQALRDVEPLRGAAISVGTLGNIRRALDQLRDGRAPETHIETAERIAIAAHRLALAVGGQNDVEEAAIRAELLQLYDAWLDIEAPVH